MTAGQVFKMFRQMPEMRELVESCYLDEDLIQAAQRFYQSKEFQVTLALHKLKPNSLVLDLGGGNGIVSLAWHWAGHRAILVEPDPDPIVGTGAIHPLLETGEYNINIASAFSENLPFPDGMFDIFYARQVLHHVTSLEQTCSEAYRVLKPGGLLIIVREHVITKPEDVEVFRQNHPVHQYTGEENAHLLKSYTRAVEQAGFHQLKVLGPWNSIINYYPIPQQQVARQCYYLFRKVVGSFLAQQLIKWTAMLQLGGRYLNARDHTPGRLYSFVARR